LLLLVGAASFLVIMTASRSSVVLGLGMLLMVATERLRRSVSVLVLLAAIALSAWYAGLQPETNLERMESLEGNRTEILESYVERSVEQQLVLGLLQTNGQSVLVDEVIGAHPHNAYVYQLYLGGLAVFLSEFAMTIATLFYLIYLRRRRDRWQAGPAYGSLVLAFVLAAHAHGFVNGAIQYPNSAWAWLYVFFGSWVLADGRQMASSARTTEALHPRSVNETA